MSTKIDGVDSSRGPTVGSGSAVKPQGPASARSAAASAAGSASGNVSITGAASQLAALEQSVRSLPAVDQSRVDAVRSALDQGTYTVSSGAIADGLMKMDHMLASATSASQKA